MLCHKQWQFFPWQYKKLTNLLSSSYTVEILAASEASLRCVLSGVATHLGIDRVCRGLASSRIRTLVCCMTVRSVSTKMPPIQFLLLSLIRMYKTKIHILNIHTCTRTHTHWEKEEESEGYNATIRLVGKCQGWTRGCKQRGGGSEQNRPFFRLSHSQDWYTYTYVAIQIEWD
jgi:hypothetical protein